MVMITTSPLMETHCEQSVLSENHAGFDTKSSGWWLTYPSEKYEFVNGKDDIPYIYIYI